MTLELILFSALFVVTIGIVAIGILMAFNIQKKYNQPFAHTLLYQQIFFFSFLVYSIWGKIAIQQFTANLNIEQEIINKVLFYIPLLGIPFLMISWYMTLKLVIQLRGKIINSWFILAFFILFPVLFTIAFTICQNNHFGIQLSLEAVLPRIFLFLNFLIQLIGIIIFGVYKTSPKSVQLPLLNVRYVASYIIIVIGYSVGLWAAHNHYLIGAATVLFLFVANAGISAIIYEGLLNMPTEENLQDLDFMGFCNQFEISKREGEIIREICSGKSNKEIADVLFITLQTVKDHTHRIYTKTGIKNRTQLANLVREKLNSTQIS